MISVQTLANKNMTQKTHRQDAPASRILTKKKKVSSKSQESVQGTYYPLIIGPSTGPRNTLAVKKLVAGPRPAADQISAMTPTSTIR